MTEIIEKWLAKIPTLTQKECATLLRYAESGHALFSSGDKVYKAFLARLNETGGMTPEVSKEINEEYQQNTLKIPTI
jgi:hypothetical protein